MASQEYVGFRNTTSGGGFGFGSNCWEGLVVALTRAFVSGWGWIQLLSVDVSGGDFGSCWWEGPIVVLASKIAIMCNSTKN